LIVSLIREKDPNTPRNEEEGRLKDKFSKYAKADEIKDKDLLEYIYVLLGGLVRTEVEHKVAEENAEKIKKGWDKKSASAKEKEEGRVPADSK